MPRQPSCECGKCPLCHARERNRRYYRRITIERGAERDIPISESVRKLESQFPWLRECPTRSTLVVTSEVWRDDEANNKAA